MVFLKFQILKNLLIEEIFTNCAKYTSEYNLNQEKISQLTSDFEEQLKLKENKIVRFSAIAMNISKTNHF